MKKFLACAFSAALSFPVPAQDAGARQPLTLYAIKGPTAVALIGLFEKPPEIPGFAVSMEALAQADLMAARLISGDIMVGMLPVNVAAKIAASGKPLRLAALTGGGMLSLLTLDEATRSPADLKGKRVAVAGQGAVPEFVFRAVLERHGLAAGKDVTLDFSLAYPEIARSLIAGKIKTALLPEPFATMALRGNAALRRAGDMRAEWRAVSGQDDYPMTALVVNAAFAGRYPGATRIILERVKSSIEWTVSHPSEAGPLAEKHGLGITAAAASASIPRANYVYQSAAAARPALEALFSAFLRFAPASIGGRLPDDSFYLALP